MKKLLLLAGILVMLATTSANAQVSIGKPIKPAEPYSALEIISNGEKGLRLPQLKTAQLDALAVQIKAITGDEQKKLAEGLMIFNTDTKCMNYWNGTKWVSLCLGSSKINFPNDASRNYKLSGKTCLDVKQINDDANCGTLSSRPNDFASTKSFPYTFSSPTGFPYSDLHFMVLDTNSLVSNTSVAKETFIVTFKDNIASLAAGTDKTTAKKLTIIAQYKDNTGAYKQVSLVVSVQDCICGCSVRAGGNNWLTFMCYNLGADETMSIAEQMAYTPKPSGAASTDSTVYGALYQWGRQTDGHQKRNSPRYLTDSNTPQDSPLVDDDLDGNGQVPNTHAAYGKFIKNNTTHDWRKTTNLDLWYKENAKTVNDPCPIGWRVPINNEWKNIASVVNNMSSTSWLSAGISGNRVRLHTTGTSGVEFSADGGKTTALFLPATGYRKFNSGEIIDAGTSGYYWSSTIGTNAYYLGFTIPTQLASDYTQYRGNAASVRCVRE